MKYAVMITIEENELIYVSMQDEKGRFQPRLFNSREAAERHADVWRKPGKENLVRVVEYKEESDENSMD